jgi:signal transduction histidine kinase
VPAFVQAGNEERFAANVEAAMYFVVSEALANVAKHAAAGRIDIRLSRDKDLLAVDVIDNGVGGADVGRGTGIVGLRDRLDAVGGTLEITSPAGRGTHLRATIPVGGAAVADQACLADGPTSRAS